MKFFFYVLTSVLLTSFSGSLQAQPVDPFPSPDLSQFPEIIPSTTPRPIQSPRGVPTPVSTPVPTQSPEHVTPAQVKLKIHLPELMEGKKQLISVSLENHQYLPATAFPLKGELSYNDTGYNQKPLGRQKIGFELTQNGQTTVPILFQSAGRHDLKISLRYPGIPERHLKVYSHPFPASVFPLAGNTSDFEKDPELWHVWVNLHHRPGGQRQYYLVTYKGEIVQRLLTSSAAPGKITPTGQFRLGPKIASPKSTLYESVMPFWTTILVPAASFEYGNHGLVGESYLYLLGTPASHGCLRLSNKWIQQNGEWLNIGGAKWVFHHVPAGTPIEIFRAPVQPFAFETYAMWLSKKRV
jgi:hypothetical protein